MENFNINNSIEFESEELNFWIKNLNACFNNANKNFAGLCLVVYKIHSYINHRYFQAKDNDYYNVYSLLAKFGFDKKAVSRYRNSYEYFCENDTVATVKLKSKFIEFTPSKLFELLPLEKESIDYAIDKKFVASNMPCKEIRIVVKDLIHGVEPSTMVSKVDETEKKEEINESEIPLVYDPTKEYDFEYFKDKTKNQLINMIWDLQKAYQKLKKKAR